MSSVLAIGLLIVALIVHEAGHAIAMTRRGVSIQEAGLGLPVGRFKLTLRPRWLPYPVHLYPLLVGAYVQPTEEGNTQLERMGYKDRATCYAAGVIMNIVFTCVLIACYSAWLLASSPDDGTRLATLATVVVIGVAVLLLRRQISRVVPLLGIGCIALVVYLMTQSLDNVGGPVAVVGIATSASTLSEAVLTGADLSFGLALINMVPLIPLDGGRVMVALLERWGFRAFSKRYSVVTVVIFLLFFGFLIVHDFM